MERTWKPTTAGIVLILSGGSTLIARIVFHYIVYWSTDPLLWLAAVLGIVTIIGGYSALRRIMRGLAFAGAICTMILIFEGILTAMGWEYPPANTIFLMLFMVGVPLAIFTIVLLALSKQEFARRRE